LILIDTNIAIALRDGDRASEAAVADLGIVPFLSQVTHIELEGGAYRDPSIAALRRILLDRLLTKLRVLGLSEADVRAYGQIVAACGFDRRRILDRLIAAQCLTRSATLVTRNPRDFHDIQGLKLLAW
jgi:tRNA(fMet)-specific endonuclease VapC